MMTPTEGTTDDMVMWGGRVERGGLDLPIWNHGSHAERPLSTQSVAG